MKMRQWIRWLFLSWKRLLKRPFFLLFLFLLPIGTILVRQTEQADDGTIEIALFIDGDPWNEQVGKVLTEAEGAFRFYLCDTREELEDDVAAGRAECGYSFPAGLRERLNERDYKRAIRVTVSPATVIADLASETVFAGLFEVYGRELLKDYVENGEVFSEAQTDEAAGADFDSGVHEVWATVEMLYDRYLEDGSTFAFEYETIGSDASEPPQMQAVFPVRGIGAVFLFVMALAAAVMSAQDEERGLYRAVSGGRKWGYQLVSIGAQVGICCLVFGICMIAAGEWRETVPEIMRLLIYGTATVLVSGGLLRLLKKPVVLAGLIPFFILGSLVVCPVFVDLSIYVPIVKVMRWMFLPWYYLGV